MELSHLWWKIRQLVTKTFDISCVSIWCLIACQQQKKKKSANHVAATHCTQTFSNRNGKEREDWVVSQPAADLLGFSPHHNHLQRPQRTDPESEHIIQRVEAMRRKTLCGHQEVGGQSWHAGWRPWKGNRKWNKHCLQPGSAEWRLWKLVISNLDPSCIQSRIISKTVHTLFH